MSELIEVSRKWIADHDFDPAALTVSDDGKQTRFKYESSREGETYEAFLDLDIDNQWVELFLYAPSHVPAKRRRTVAELLALINANIRLGSLDLLMTDGRVRFRCGADMEGGTLDVKMIDNMDGMACRALDMNYPAIMAVAYAGHSPERAFAELMGESLSDKPDPAWTASEGEPPAWDRFPGTRCLQRWAEELKIALSEGCDANDWKLLGHGAIIKHEDIGRAQTMFRRVAVDSGMKFAVVPSEAVLDLPLGVVDPFRSIAPVMVFLEPGEWMHPINADKSDSEDAAQITSFRARLINRLIAFDKDHPVVFVTAAYDMVDIDKGLRACGVLDRRFAVAQLPMNFVGAEFIDSIGRDLCGDSLTLATAKVGKIVSGQDTNRERGLKVLAMKRLARREARKVEFIDLVNYGTRGTVESDEPAPDAESIRRQTAYHEAGHAMVMILDSAGRNLPEYASIIASSGFKGVVVDSAEYLYSMFEEQLTYREFLHQVRAYLAGRAAEQVLVGSEEISNGASSDLEGATRMAREAFAHFGFTPGMSDPVNSGLNLAVISDEPSLSELAHIEVLVRQFLAEEYQYVLDLLNTHRSLLDVIADRLLWDPVVDQSEMVSLCAEHHVDFAKINRN